MHNSRNYTRLSLMISLPMAAALTLAGCGTTQTPTTDTSPTQEASINATDVQETLSKISAELGEDFVQGWVADGKIHVSTTNAQAQETIEAAGAQAHVVKYSSEQVRQGITHIMQWQSQQDPDIAGAIHGYSLDPESGGITLSVEPSQRERIESSLTKDKPAGEIPLTFRDSSGISSPAAGNASATGTL